MLEDREKEQAEKILARELKKIIGDKVKNRDEDLVVGLGNEEVTPDALGPNVVKNVEIR